LLALTFITSAYSTMLVDGIDVCLGILIQQMLSWVRVHATYK